MARFIKKIAKSNKIPKAMRWMKRITKKKNSGRMWKLPASKLEKMLQDGLVVMKENKKVDSGTVDGCELDVEKKYEKVSKDENNENQEWKQEIGEYVERGESEEYDDLKCVSSSDDDLDINDGEVEEWNAELQQTTGYQVEEDEEDN